VHDPLTVAFQVRRPWPRKFHGVLEGRRYWPAVVVVWHREPGGHDSGEVCKRYRRVFDEATRTWHQEWSNRWRLHFWHWRIQVPPLQDLRRWALTRCAWCGGPSRRGDLVNVSHSWDGPRGRWWQGTPGVFHSDCSAVALAHALCFCKNPLLQFGDHGTCLICGKFRAWRKVPDEADRLLAAIPPGTRITPDRRPAIEAAWTLRRALSEAGKEAP
jgi:hypothetical protein